MSEVDDFVDRGVRDDSCVVKNHSCLEIVTLELNKSIDFLGQIREVFRVELLLERSCVVRKRIRMSNQGVFAVKL